jgi:hypothetical protein
MLPLASSQIAPLILSLTQLKNEYCNRSKCMDCVGTTLLKKEDNLLLNFIGLVSVLVIDIRTNESKNPKSYKIEIFLEKYGFMCLLVCWQFRYASYKCTLVFIYVSFVTAGLWFGVYLTLAFWIKLKDLIRAKDLLYLICKNYIKKKKSIILFVPFYRWIQTDYLSGLFRFVFLTK